MSVRRVFKMPVSAKITGRKSTITNSFVSAIIPARRPTDEEITRALADLEQEASDLRCVYCGDPYSYWDHFRPIVREKRPTGFITESANLVPACRQCNESKGASDWREWMRGPARHSPASRGIADLDQRFARLERFERTRQPTVIDFAAIVPPHLLAKHWANLQRLHDLMHECQLTADAIRSAASSAGGA